jgi:hypothetical protein
MNHLFNYKAGLIILAVLVCGTALRARNSFKADHKTRAVKADTSFTPKTKSGNTLKSDTTINVKAGSTIIQKADTTLVINGDPKFSDEIVPNQTQVVKNNNDISAPKIDTPLSKIDTPLKKKDTASTVKKDTTSTVKKDTTSTVKTDNNQQTPTDNSNNAPGTTTTVPDIHNPASIMMIDINTPPPNTFIQKRVGFYNDSTRRADSILNAKRDTTKKADSTLMKKSDTTKMASDSLPEMIKAQSAYVEVGGPGLAISANFDSRFHKERGGWGYRIGAGYFSSGGNTVFTVPFQINYLIGQHTYMGELGAGTTFLHSTGTNMGNSKWQFDNVTGLIATATIGFRYQPEASGLTVRIAFVPILYDEGLVPAGGVSIGWTFK